MVAIELFDHRPKRAGYGAPGVDLRGSARSSVFLPERTSLWALDGMLEAGATLTWPADHGDQGILVRSGRVEVDGRECGAPAAIVIESEAHPRLRALEVTHVYHVGSGDFDLTEGLFGSPRAGRCNVHVVDVVGRWPAPEEEPELEFFADSCCETCRISFFNVTGAGRYVSPSHVHSQDEIIHLLDGELRIGSVVARPGSSVFIAAGQRYGFRATGPFRFLNYRRDASMVTLRPGSAPIVERGRGEPASEPPKRPGAETETETAGANAGTARRSELPTNGDPWKLS